MTNLFSTIAFEILQSGKQYEVVIVGSGAGGDMAANMLSKADLSVAVTEACRDYDLAEEYRAQFSWP